MINKKKTGIGILTFNRSKTFQRMFLSLMEHCERSLDFIVVSDDGSDWENKESIRNQVLLESNHKIILLDNDKNIGVAGNSNRLIKKLYDLNCDYIFLVNDDLLINKDVISLYRDAYIINSINIFCFRKWSGHANDRVESIKLNDYRLTFMPRVTGHWMFLHRDIIDRIGYMDRGYGKFGEEHTDYVYRAIQSGAVNYPSSFINRIGTFDVGDSINFLDIQKVLPAIFDNNEWTYWSSFSSAYHRNKWARGKVKKIYDPYKEECNE